MFRVEPPLRQRGLIWLVHRFFFRGQYWENCQSVSVTDADKVFIHDSFSVFALFAYLLKAAHPNRFASNCSKVPHVPEVKCSSSTECCICLLVQRTSFHPYIKVITVFLNLGPVVTHLAFEVGRVVLHFCSDQSLTITINNWWSEAASHQSNLKNGFVKGVWWLFLILFNNNVRHCRDHWCFTML